MEQKRIRAYTYGVVMCDYGSDWKDCPYHHAWMDQCYHQARCNSDTNCPAITCNSGFVRFQVEKQESEEK